MQAPSHVRLAVPGDARAVAVIQVEAWRTAYAGLMPDAVLAALSVDERAETWRARLSGVVPTVARLWVAEVEGRVLGFASTGPSRDADRQDGDGELWALYVHPDAWGRGAGRALLARAQDALREDGARAMILWVLEGNTRARRFYEAAGMRADGARKDEDVGGTPLPHVRYRLPLPPPG